MSYVWSHTRLWWCNFDIFALIILMVTLIVCLWKLHNKKEEIRKLDTKLDELRNLQEN